MRTIGLIGGMSWESTAHYYAHLNRLAMKRLGGVHSAPILLHSFDFAPIEELQRKGDWTELARRLGAAGAALERAGAAFILITANTMHKVAEETAAHFSVPLLHIVDPAGAAISAAGLKKIGLLGTAYTMESPFFTERLGRRFGVSAIVPEDEDRGLCHRIIFEELVKGIVAEPSRATYREIIRRLIERGAQGIILGCTELSMVVDAKAVPAPVFDTAALHAAAAIDAALDEAAFDRLSAGREGR